MPTRPDDDDLPDPSNPLLPGTPEATDAGLAELLDNSRWADDAPEEELPLPREATTAGAPEAWRDAPDDDDGTAIEPAVTEEAPLPSLADEPAVIQWRTEALVDGAPTPVRADPGAAFSQLRRADTLGTQRIRIRLAGRVVHLTIDVAEGPPQLVLGRDALAGRFLIATDTP